MNPGISRHLWLLWAGGESDEGTDVGLQRMRGRATLAFVNELKATVLAVSLVLIVGCKSKQEPPQATASPSEENAADSDVPVVPAATPTGDGNADIASRQQECAGYWREKNADALAKCFHEDAVATFAGTPGELEGVNAIIGALESQWTTFPDLERRAILTLVHGGDAVALVSRLGTMKGELAIIGGEPMQATNNKFGDLGAQRFTWEGGRIKAVHGVWNVGGVLSQLRGNKGGRQLDRVLPMLEEKAVVSAGSAEEKAALEAFRSHLAIFNGDDVSSIGEGYTDDAVFYDSGRSQDAQGREAIQAFFVGFKSGFPDGRLEVENVWAAGDYVFADALLAGTQKGSDKAIRIDIAIIYRIENGKIARQWAISNSQQTATQLGMIPSPKPAAQ